MAFGDKQKKLLAKVAKVAGTTPEGDATPTVDERIAVTYQQLQNMTLTIISHNATSVTITARNNGIALLANAGFINLLALHD